MAEKADRFRPDHMRTADEAKSAHDARRRESQPWRKWYNTARWKRLRLVQLSRVPLCEMCAEKGLTVAATVCDHGERHRGDEVRFWAGPFRSLCEDCHNRDKQQQENRARFGFSIPDGMKPSAVTVHLVCGAPGSGKSTFVKANAKAGDVVIDMDEIRHGLGLTRFDDTKAALHQALTVRNRMIDGLCQMKGWEAWLIAGAPTSAERRAWMLALGSKAVMHVMHASEHECRRRIMAEVDAEKRAPQRLKGLRGWFAAAAG